MNLAEIAAIAEIIDAVKNFRERHIYIHGRRDPFRTLRDLLLNAIEDFEVTDEPKDDPPTFKKEVLQTPVQMLTFECEQCGASEVASGCSDSTGEIGRAHV